MNTTKSLAELTNEVLKSKMSVNAKCQALIKLGLTRYEAQCLATLPGILPEAAAPFAFTFGVEIECVNCVHSDFFSAALRNGLRTYDQVYYNHNDMPVYKLTTDSSLSGDNTAECVTPALTGNEDGFASLENCCKTLSEIGASVNSSCGLHVHIGAESLTDKEYCNVFVNYMMLEEAINSFLAPSRRGVGSHWCKSLRNHMTDVLAASTKEGMRKALDSDRYHRVNANAYRAHKTIEFRQHQGSTNYTKISNWVKFLAKLVEYSKTNRMTDFVSRIEDIPFLNEEEKSYFIHRREYFDFVA